jgi:hypothetical protein
LIIPELLLLNYSGVVYSVIIPEIIPEIILEIAILVINYQFPEEKKAYSRIIPKLE